MGKNTPRPLVDLFKIYATFGMLPNHLSYETASKTKANWSPVTPELLITANPSADPGNLGKGACTLDLK